MYSIYKIEKGETLEDISKKFNTSLSNLKRINGLQETTTTFEGKYIIVPAKKDKLFENYIIKKGDTIYDIAKKHEIDVNTLLKLNGLLKTDYIYPGEELIIPINGVDVYITKEDDTLSSVADKLKSNVGKIVLENETIYLLPEQLIVSKSS